MSGLRPPWRATLAVAALWALLAAPVVALSPEERLSDPALESRAREISKELRCVVCQNQSIDDSDADIAKDMRKLVRDRLQEGDSDDEVLARMVDYYGEYVLLRPKFSLKNAALWASPLIALLIAGVWYARRTGRLAGAEGPIDGVDFAEEDHESARDLTPEERARVEALMKE